MKKQVRRAQEAVLSTRPFNEGLQSVFSGLVKRLAIENIELPLLQVRLRFSWVRACDFSSVLDRPRDWTDLHSPHSFLSFPIIHRTAR